MYEAYQNGKNYKNIFADIFLFPGKLQIMAYLMFLF